MGAAAIISLGEVREKKQRAEDRRELHERFDHWLDTLAAQMKTPKPTLEELTRAVWEQRHELTGHLTAALVAQQHRAAHEQRSAPCPAVWADCNSPGGGQPHGGHFGGGGGSRPPLFLLRALWSGVLPLGVVL